MLFKKPWLNLTSNILWRDFAKISLKFETTFFKKTIIFTTFERSGIYSIDYTETISLLRKFVRGTMQKKNRKKRFFFSTVSSSEFELFRIRFQTLHEMKVGLNEWKNKIAASNVQWNDSARKKELNQYVNFTQQMIAEFQFKNYELFLHQKRRQNELLQKFIFRKRLKSTIDVFEIIKEDVLAAIIEKRRKENELTKKKKHNMYMKFWRTERDAILTKKFIARKNGKARIKKIKEYIKRKIEMSDENKCAIVNPKIEWKATNFTWLADKAKKAQTKKKSVASF